MVMTLQECLDYIYSSSQSDLELLERAVYDRRHVFERRAIIEKNIQLDDAEKELVEDDQYIAAIKSVRSRLECSLFMAKTVVDNYKDTL